MVRSIGQWVQLRIRSQFIEKVVRYGLGLVGLAVSALVVVVQLVPKRYGQVMIFLIGVSLIFDTPNI